MVGAQALVMAAMQQGSQADSSGSWRLGAAGGGSGSSRPEAAAVGAAVPAGVQAGRRHKGKDGVDKRMQRQVSMLTHTSHSE